MPVAVHTIFDAFLQSSDLGKVYLYMAAAAALIFAATAVITVIKVFRWQKNKTLDIPVNTAQQQERENVLIILTSEFIKR